MALTIYCYRDEAGIPTYVGSTFADLKQRDAWHRKYARAGHHFPLYALMRKENLTLETLQVREDYSKDNPVDVEAARHLEQHWMDRMETDWEECGGTNTKRAVRERPKRGKRPVMTCRSALSRAAKKRWAQIREVHTMVPGRSASETARIMGVTHPTVATALRKTA